MSLTPNEVLEQSRSAMKQWEDKWRSHASKNGEIYKRDQRTHQDLLFSGAGRKLLMVALSPSFEKSIGKIKENINESTDIGCIDKCLGSLLEHNLKPKYVFLADASVSYEDWCGPWIDKTEDIILVSNVTANPEWCENWKGPIFFYVNKDNIQTEKIFSELSGCYEQIPASSNVGNTQIVFATQVLGYDEYLMIGYDSCWADDENYYAFKDNDKRYWMKHLHLIDSAGRMVQTSQNLLFSARWLSDFYQASLSKMGIKIYNCGPGGIVSIPKIDLERKLKSSKIRKLPESEKQNILRARKKQIVISQQEGEQRLKEVLGSCNVAEVIVNHIPQEVNQWIQAL